MCAESGGREEKWWSGLIPWSRCIACQIRIFQVCIECFAILDSLTRILSLRIYIE